ncbi:hypothetical protein DFJ74DRAFT_490241 [Hyaloraphidium curvatum]|nr:hypothetical protein DFJ74DRAFT_490241 [Hyaloraphidium curvatum]
MAALCLVDLALASLAAVWGGGRGSGAFGARQVAGGLAALALFAVGVVGSAAIAVLLSRRAAAAGGPRGWFLQPATPNALDLHPYARMTRWLRLCRAEPDSPLIAHEERDPRCPCPAGSCAGALVLRGATANVVDVATNTLVVYAAQFLINYSALVTYSSELWAPWWGVLLGTLACRCAIPPARSTPEPEYLGNAPAGVTIAAYGLNGIDRVNWIRILPISSLEERLYHRAVTIAFRDLFGWLDAALAAPPIPAPDRKAAFGDADRPLYRRLHVQMASAWLFWDSQDMGFLARSSLYFGIPPIVLGFVISMAAGSCVPSWLLAVAATYLLFFVINLVNLAGSNAVLEAVARLYHDARMRLREVACDAASRPDAEATATVANRRGDGLHACRGGVEHREGHGDCADARGVLYRAVTQQARQRCAGRALGVRTAGT